MNLIYKQQFIHFLKQNNVYGKYMLYVSNHKIPILNSSNPLELIVLLKSKEEDWKRLSKEWTKHINKKFFIPLFLQFLEDNNIYDDYIKHIPSTPLSPFVRKYNFNLEEYLSKEPPYMFIREYYYEFTGFWQKKSTEWIRYYKNAL